MIDELLADAGERMEAAIEHTASEFATVRTGRANPQILQRVTVDYYGTRTPLQQLATIGVPEPRLLVVQPYDKSSLSDVERAIQEADLGLSPSNDGTVIRLAFPTLTEDRRKDLIRVVKQMAEEGRVSVRQVRRHTKDDIESLAGDVSDDDIRRAEKRLQELTDEHTDRIDAMLEAKEHELMEV
jgi:ribosome recycling factor